MKKAKIKALSGLLTMTTLMSAAFVLPASPVFAEYACEVPLVTGNDGQGSTNKAYFASSCSNVRIGGVLTSGGIIQVVSTASNVVVDTIFISGMSGFTNLVLSPNGSLLYGSSQFSGTVVVINTTTNAPVATVPVGTGPTNIAISPDGSKVYVSNQSDDTVSVINATTNAVTATIPVGDYPSNITVSPDGSKTFVSNYNDNSVSVINTATNAVTATIPIGSRQTDLAVSSDSTKLYVASSSSASPYVGDGKIFVINTSTNTISNTIPTSNNLVGLVISQDGSKLFSTGFLPYTISGVTYTGNGELSVINTSTEVITGTTQFAMAGWLQGATISADGAKIYAFNMVEAGVYTESEVFVFETSTNALTSTFLTNISSDIAIGQTTPPQSYSVISGADAVWKPGSTTGLKFTADGDLTDFIGVRVNGKLLIQGVDYIVTSGSTIIMLLSEYLNTLGAGTHNIEIIYINGVAYAQFTVNRPGAPNSGFFHQEEDGAIVTGIAPVALVLIIISGFILIKKQLSKKPR